MANITFMGVGAMGSRMALNLIRAGHNVCVWNRSADRSTPLIEAGASAANSSREAAKNADFVISMLRDNEASRRAWSESNNGALAGMKAGAVAIECSTLTVEWVRELYQRCAEKNIALLDAPVAGSRPQAEAAQLIFFVGGDKTALEQAQPVLNSMGSTIHYAGSSAAGASVKLAINALFGIQLAAMAELIGFFRGAGLDASLAVDILAATPVCSPAAKLAAGAMLAGKFAPLFPIELVDKDFSYALASAEKGGTAVPMMQAAGNIYKKALAKGFGGDNITGVAKLYL